MQGTVIPRDCISKGEYFQGGLFPSGLICKGINLQGIPVSKALFPRPNFQGPISKPQISKAQHPRFNLQVPNFKALHLSFAAKGQRQLGVYFLN